MASPQPEEPVVSEQHEQQDDPMQGTAPAQPEEGEGEVEDAPMSDDSSEEPEEDEEEGRQRSKVKIDFMSRARPRVESRTYGPAALVRNNIFLS